MAEERSEERELTPQQEREFDAYCKTRGLWPTDEHAALWQFATAVERERCAKIAEDMGWVYNPIADAVRKGEAECAIR